jgi:membrane protein YdbS with pleckstrin-like domain
MPEYQIAEIMMDKLQPLLKDLIYPAFLGAALVDFVRPLVVEGEFADALHQDPIWFFSGLWFLLYFSIAYSRYSEGKKLGWPAFAAGLVEVLIILVTSFIVTSSYKRGQPSQLDYHTIYLSWIGIPITAFLSNYFSSHSIRTVLSVSAIAIGALGCFQLGDSHEAYAGALFIMYLLLAVYMLTVFPRCKLNVFCLDVKRKDTFGLELTKEHCPSK